MPVPPTGQEVEGSLSGWATVLKPTGLLDKATDAYGATHESVAEGHGVCVPKHPWDGKPLAIVLKRSGT